MNERLKELRKFFGLKQRQLAERLGVTIGLVGNWEAGSQPISKPRIYQICKEFGVRREWLEDGKGEMLEPPSGARKLEEFSDAELSAELINRIFKNFPDEAKKDFIRSCISYRWQGKAAIPISELITDDDTLEDIERRIFKKNEQE
jgi:transcriptional regulator with XRE-family HTH domain